MTAGIRGGRAVARTSPAVTHSNRRGGHARTGDVGRRRCSIRPGTRVLGRRALHLPSTRRARVRPAAAAMGLAHREYRLLGELESQGTPAVSVLGVCVERPPVDGVAQDAVLVTRYLDYSM